MTPDDYDGGVKYEDDEDNENDYDTKDNGEVCMFKPSCIIRDVLDYLDVMDI